MHEPCAWHAVNAATFTMSLYVQPRDRSFTGFLRPCSSGPIALAPASLSTNLYAILAASRFGKMSTFASPCILLFGHFFSATLGTNAASTCNSPSAIMFGCLYLNI